MLNQVPIRNFCIIAHVDHGKSTLADCLLRETNTISERQLQPQHLDMMELERERGITIKLQPVQMNYQGYILNLIDTPGHIDFAYEVSRSLAAVEGALLLVDASQGIQAQTLANLHLAQQAGLTIIPVVTKADLPAADIEQAIQSLSELIGVAKDAVIVTSAKNYQGINQVLQTIIKRIPPPLGENNAPLQALVFDSKFDEYRGVVAYVRVMSGRVKKGERVYLIATQTQAEVLEVGFFKPQLTTGVELPSGQIGYIVLAIKKLAAVPVGDTITHANRQAVSLPGYKAMPPMVFASFFSRDGSQFEQLRQALIKLQLTDASLQCVPERSSVLGKGFRCGFLGLLHMEIIKERLLREYGIEILLTSPSVAYEVTLASGEVKMISAPSDWPVITSPQQVKEPYVEIEIITPPAWQGAMIQLVASRRGHYHTVYPLPGQRLRLVFDLPLAEILVDFYDQLKSLSSGYASMAYTPIDYRPTNIVRLDILLAEEKIEGLSRLVYHDYILIAARDIVKLLKDLVPRQQFEVKIQAVIGGKIVAAERLPALRKDVTAKLYGGDVTRKRKLLAKQKLGKKKLAKRGTIELSSDIYWQVFKPRSSSRYN